MARKKRRGLLRVCGLIAGHIVLLAGAAVMIVPFLWMLSASLKPLSEVILIPPTWIPRQPTLTNYLEVWNELGFSRYFFNSAFASIAAVVGVLLTSSMAGYAFTRYRFPGRRAIFLLILATMMIPSQVLMIPCFILMVHLGWVDTYAGLIAPSLVSAFGIFMMRQFMQGIPSELIDAARIDGCSEPRILWSIVMPLCRPALATLAVFTFLTNWGALLWPLIIANSSQHWTLPVALSKFTEQYISRTNLQMAASTITFVPVLILFFLAQRQFIEGITLSGLKG